MLPSLALCNITSPWNIFYILINIYRHGIFILTATQYSFIYSKHNYIFLYFLKCFQKVAVWQSTNRFNEHYIFIFLREDSVYVIYLQGTCVAEKLISKQMNWRKNTSHSYPKIKRQSKNNPHWLKNIMSSNRHFDSLSWKLGPIQGSELFSTKSEALCYRLEEYFTQ